MEELNFRIILMPVEKYLTEDEMKEKLKMHFDELKINFEACGLRNVNLSFLKARKSEEDNPEIEESVIQVTSQIYCESKILKYQRIQEFRSAWRYIFSPNSSPMLEFYENDNFLNTRKHSHLNVSCTDIAFGVLPYDGFFHRYSSLGINGQGDFFHDTRSVSLTYINHELIFPYNNIKNLFINIDSMSNEIFFDLSNPPLIFQVEHKYSRYIGRYTIRRRIATIAGFLDVNVLGRANTLRISFSKASIVEEIIGRIHFRCGEKPIYYAHIVSASNMNYPYYPSLPDFRWSNFGCTYLMTAVLQRNFILLVQTTNIHSSLSVLKDLCERNGDSMEKALTLALSALETGKKVNYWHAIERQFYYYLNNKDEIDFMHYVVPEKCCMIRRITLTPTRTLLWPPEIMFGNRVLRKYDSEYAVRVSFRDDDNSRLSFNAAYANENIFQNAIKNPMKAGIYIGNRKYEFLAWSNSQIRDHGIWMYARDQMGNTVDSIRKWMGDFSHIHSVNKYMARMGQCFSQTEDAIKVPLDRSHIRIEKDIERGSDVVNNYKPYCFSDGIGRISSKLANEVHQALGHDKLCSAFQIRYGGCKGMLVVDPTLKDADIVFRESMKKFDSPENQRLEIARTSAPIRLQLNRPFITLLNDLGVRHRTFLKLQEDMLRSLTDMLFEEKQAFEFLTSKTPSDIFKYKDLSESGIYLTTEPFFRSLLLALNRHYVHNLKTRANITIDPSKGRNMLGVLDETGLLKYGEVFVKYTKDISYGETTKDTTVLIGEVLVTKNPCVLPGDVRKFEAKNIPQLHHIVDCIVFPQNGPRPHPNEMSGSDLDGDEYAVLWDKDLIFQFQNHPPGHFPSASVPDIANITVTHMIECLVNYIKNDQVGTIANAHLAHADKQNIFSPICKKIAGKYSYAVDFAKTGVSANLDREERPLQYPDFMEKNHKETYKSGKALGKMFRVVKDFESENECASDAYHDIQVDEDLKYPGWERYKADAIKSRNKYNALLRTVLRNYGIQHEAEVFSGAFTNLHCRFHEKKDKAEIEKVVVRCIKRLTKSMKEEFIEEFREAGNLREVYEAMLQKASAWYVVTYQDNKAKILSFPWTVSEYLANIKIRKVPVQSSPLSPLILKMDRQIKLRESTRQLPPFQETQEWREYDILCGDPNIVKLALRVLILWAEEEDIIAKPGYSSGGLMFHSVFIRLFLHVAENSEYIVKKGKKVLIPKKNFSPASLCVDFWRFCLRLRFYHESEIKDVIPFQVYKYSTLSKRAVVTFQRFAATGEFQYLNEESNIMKELIQMKPFHIESKIFERSPIDELKLRKASETLAKYSCTEYVTLREVLQTKKICVMAVGTEQSLKELKRILNKKHVFLRQLFSSGVMPES